ncbi:MAG: hypothetical protein A2912_03085 [Candidatus Buchananbacteria bacterium RIFCSPLOWO2_01_FULL_40_23b]|uniref:Uncharacterized protein n=1 Tax=Candidatus Buchananbacteria bacterium RIFCSPLOWO2_01_FULL_40_23b TaxID=1797544 RepID=A0A1G1YUC4_9BACT|nr:MAG: hypothetical protein A2912_03085 [Candidatus Buchananbacteria bacterium RIFCSPLOWO2_01_FULL_40_23b]
MASANQNQNNPDDFFRPLEEQKQQAKMAADEIIFRDEAGKLKILKDGEVLDFEENKSQIGRTFQSGVEGKSRGINLAKEPAVAVKALPSKPLIIFDEKFQRRNIDRELEEIIKNSGITFSDENLVKRFRNVVSSRLKEVRDQIQAREILLSSPAMGGIGLNAQSADRVLTLINQQLEQMNGKLRNQVSAESFADLHLAVKGLLAQPLPKPPPIVFSPKNESVIKQNIFSEPPKVMPKILEKPMVEIPSMPVISPKPANRSMPENNLTESVTVYRPAPKPLTQKPKIQDIRFEPRLTGPVEEIKTMTLDDFRRLAPTPVLAIEKILEKIQLLEQESFTKKVAAIKSWKENKISRLYFELGEQSMEEKKPVTEIIARRQAQGQPILTVEELEAVIELNQRLRY